MGRQAMFGDRANTRRSGVRTAALITAALAILAFCEFSIADPVVAASPVQMIATGLTAPRGVVADPASRLWVSDAAKGFCRLSAPSGSTPGAIEATTCLGAASGNRGPKLPGQAALLTSSAGTTVLVPDAAKGAAGVMRAQWNAGAGTFSYRDTLTIFGGSSAPAAVAVGADGHAYVVLGGARAIVRIVDPASPQPTVETVGFTAATGNRAVVAGTLGTAGVPLYVASPTGVAAFSVPKSGIGSGGPAKTFAVVASLSLALDATGATVYAGTGGATTVGGDTIAAIDVASGQITANWASGFTRVGGMAMQGTGIAAVDSGSVAASPGATGSAYLAGAILPVIAAGPTAKEGSAAADPRYTNNPQPSFTVAFAGGGGLQCAFDDANWFICSPGPVAAPAPLADGTHSFSVRAGSTGTPARQTFTVDTVAPAAPVVTAPANGVTVGATTVLQASAETGAVMRCAIDFASAAVCTSGQTLTFTTSGSHSVHVTATDAAANTSAETLVTVVVDLTPPTVTISAPAADGTSFTGTASFTFAAQPSAGTTFACGIDSGAAGACTSPAAFTGLSAGTHTFTVRATSSLGNTASASRTFVFVVPTPTVVTATPAGGAYPAGQQISLAITPAGGVIHYTVDGSTPTSSSPIYGTALTLNQAMTLQYLGTDAQGGNPSAVVTQKYTIAVPPPATPAAQDFTSDHFNDVLAVTSGGVLWLYPGNGAGGFLAPSQAGTGWGGMTAVFTPGDWSGDGHPDVLARDGSGRLWLYPGDGSGGWGSPAVIGTGWGGMVVLL